jgi:quinol monooxygenase YgiN
MLIRIVRMTFREEHTEDFRRIFRESQELIRQQPGCQHVELWQDADDPRVFCTYSHWESVAALNAYRRSELFGQVWPATKVLFAAPAQAFSVTPVAASSGR